MNDSGQHFGGLLKLMSSLNIFPPLALRFGNIRYRRIEGDLAMGKPHYTEEQIIFHESVNSLSRVNNGRTPLCARYNLMEC